MTKRRRKIKGWAVRDGEGDGPLTDLRELNIRRPEGMHLFHTAYAEGTGFYGASLQARNWSEARTVARLRGLNETVEGETQGKPFFGSEPITVMIQRGEMLKAIHACIFMAFVGMMSGAVTPREALGDSGPLHELVHLALPFDIETAEDEIEREQLIERVMLMVTQMAHRIPGWPVHEKYEPLPDGGKRKHRVG